MDAEKTVEKLELPITVRTDLDASQLAGWIVGSWNEDQVVEFLMRIDEQANSWDFTLRVASEFTKVYSGLETLFAGDSVREERKALARVREFVEQSAVQPHVQAGSPIITTWTDPNRELAELRSSDLEILLRLAAVGLANLLKED